MATDQQADDSWCAFDRPRLRSWETLIQSSSHPHERRPRSPAPPARRCRTGAEVHPVAGVGHQRTRRRCRRRWRCRPWWGCRPSPGGHRGRPRGWAGRSPGLAEPDDQEPGADQGGGEARCRPAMSRAITRRPPRPGHSRHRRGRSGRPSGRRRPAPASPTTWVVSWPLPATRTTSPGPADRTARAAMAMRVDRARSVRSARGGDATAARRR